MLTIQTTTPERGEDAGLLPLPPVVDTQAVVLLGLLGGGRRPLLLDASSVREVQPAAEPLLEALLRCSREAGYPARLVGADAAVRALLQDHPLAAYLAESAEDEEAVFIRDCDELGFRPSLR